MHNVNLPIAESNVCLAPGSNTAADSEKLTPATNPAPKDIRSRN